MSDKVMARAHSESAIRQAAQHTQHPQSTGPVAHPPLAALFPVTNEIALGLSHLTDRSDARLAFSLAGQNAAGRMQGGRMHDDQSITGLLLVLPRIAAGLRDETP